MSLMFSTIFQFTLGMVGSARMLRLRVTNHGTEHHFCWCGHTDDGWQCQEWILKLFEVEIDQVRSGFEYGMRIQLELKLSQRTVTIRFSGKSGVALETYCQVREITSCSLEVLDYIL